MPTIVEMPTVQSVSRYVFCDKDKKNKGTKRRPEGDQCEGKEISVRVLKFLSPVLGHSLPGNRVPRAPVFHDPHLLFKRPS